MHAAQRLLRLWDENDRILAETRVATPSVDLCWVRFFLGNEPLEGVFL
jgi:hypothetical protein